MGNRIYMTEAFIFHGDCNFKKFSLPYFHHHKVNITYKYAGICPAV